MQHSLAEQWNSMVCSFTEEEEIGRREQVDTQPAQLQLSECSAIVRWYKIMGFIRKRNCQLTSHAKEINRDDTFAHFRLQIHLHEFHSPQILDLECLSGEEVENAKSKDFASI